jgi:peroxiredoxin Q/BCP
VILGISFDTVEENRAFAEKFGFPYPLLSDTDRKIGLQYHATSPGETKGARRISYLIDREGAIARAYEKVDAGAHPAQVLADIDAMA